MLLLEEDNERHHIQSINVKHTLFSVLLLIHLLIFIGRCVSINCEGFQMKKRERGL